ncbi:MAG: hypothetical protein Q8T03_03685 [Bacteroidota bacterium]|nr:hypothetical protein [Bacteroidota bacterium]
MKNLFYSFLFLSLAFFSCKKNELNGNALIKGVVKHHVKIIGNATVFIKFNAKEFPGNDTTLYDSKVRADANGNYSIKCYKGDYYLFAVGYDEDVPAPHTVKGGVPVNIRNKETVEIDIAVTE